MLKVIVVLVLVSWTGALQQDICSDLEAYYNIYKVQSNSCPCNYKNIGALRYENRQLKICNGEKYEAVCSRISEIGTEGNPARSCKEILKENPDAKSGMYYLKSAFGKSKAYCYMEKLCGEKGWTMIMKLNGNKRTFHYDSTYWKNQAVFSPESARGGLDNHETKLHTYHSFKFDRLCLGMKTGAIAKWQRLDYAADSLYSVIADGKYRPLSIGRNAWKRLIPNSSLQPHCNKEGFNSNANHKDKAKVRIGIISNQENNCLTPDSRLGFGGGGKYCGQDDTNTVGNTAKCHADRGDRNTKVMGYIFASNRLMPLGSIGSRHNPGKSCENILSKMKNAVNGIYYIKTGSKVERVYCHMDKICGSKGWTMLMKANGKKTTFTYDSALWENTATFNQGGAAGGVKDDQETKLSTYISFGFKKLCIGIKYEGKTNWIKIAHSAKSLLSLMKSGAYTRTSLGRVAWKSLIPGSSLQHNCNREGFNVKISSSGAVTRVRIGIIANQENNCLTPDSRIGIGGGGSKCGQDPNNSVGNEARCHADRGDKHVKATGYILAM